MPNSADEVTAWLDAALQRGPHPCHRIYEWPQERIASGDWTPALYYDGRLAADNDELETNPALSPASTLVATPVIDPGPVAGAVLNPLKNAPPSGGGYPVVWRHQAAQRQTMRGSIEFRVAPKPGKRRYVESHIMPRASCLLVPTRLRTNTIHVTAQIVPEPSFGSAWAPFLPNKLVARPDETMCAWCAYLNSTAGVLSYLHRRAQTLSYCRYRPAQLHAIPLPDPAKCDLTPLVSAYDRLQNIEMEPWPTMTMCPVRSALDRAAADVLAIDPALLADWRSRIAREPTISQQAGARDGASDSSIVRY